VDLDGYFGLHPRLGALKTLWDNKSLAVIHAVGSDSTRSHLTPRTTWSRGRRGGRSRRAAG
jgi:uncharacterized protein (DUF1501 family)